MDKAIVHSPNRMNKGQFLLLNPINIKCGTRQGCPYPTIFATAMESLVSLLKEAHSHIGESQLHNTQISATNK